MTLPMHARSLNREKGKWTSSYFGYLWYYLNTPRGSTFDDMTLHQAAEREFAIIDCIMRRAFFGGEHGGQLVPFSSP